MKRKCLVALLSLSLASMLRADVKPNSLFADHAVLQRDAAVPVWGTAAAGEQVTVRIGNQSLAATADESGRWAVTLKPMPAGGPFTLTISGRNTLTLGDILVGDVWVCSGQSNMERELGLRRPQKDILNWQQHVAQADRPMIRQYFVPHQAGVAVAQDANGNWAVCSPKTAASFCAVGYFFARDLQQQTKVPVGLLFTAWGGTPAEAWTSEASLKTMGDWNKWFDDRDKNLAELRKSGGTFETVSAGWYAKYDAGSDGDAWAQSDIDAQEWKTAKVPAKLDGLGLADFDGVVWFRREFTLPAEAADRDALVRLGKIDDEDTVWLNGRLIGATNAPNVNRSYVVPKSTLKPGRNVIAVRVLDVKGNGGFTSPEGDLKIEFPGGPSAYPLAGEWTYRTGVSLKGTPAPPRKWEVAPVNPSALYNAMIAPLQQFPIKGVVWYQGEANAGRAKQYRRLFPLLIQDWRKGWGEFPFLFVQIAPFRDLGPDIREAQMMTLKAVPNTAMVVTTDVGDPKDIHPANKEPVGMRLALAARSLAYGEKLEYSGPLYDGVRFKGDTAIVSFKHVGSGLVVKDGELKGFEISAADKKFIPATAKIVGDVVEVRAESVKQPAAVRFGWANVPDVNLFNREGLPASPFRSNPD